MAIIKQSSIDEVRDKVDIYSLVSNYVNLKKRGGRYVGLSPFSNEKTPSFYVDTAKNLYYCFSTSQGGDIFKFVQTKENLSFPEAVEFIADKFNITLEYEKPRGGESAAATRSLKKQIWEINELACAYFQENFFAENNTYIRDYWTNERRFDLEMAKKFRIGFAPLNWDNFKNSLLKKGYSNEAYEKCGLFFSNKHGSSLAGMLPRFRGRLTIPITDKNGQIIGFTARKTEKTPTDMDYEEGKYINTPETPVFSKKNILFNLYNAREKAVEKGYFIIVEGQLDAVRMSVSGFENTVAGQGTALGEGHFALIKNHVGKVVLLLDSDRAGQAAILRVLPICLAAGIEPMAAVLRAKDGSDSKEDPDSFIQKYGASEMQSVIDRAENAVSFVCEKLFKADFDSSSPQGKINALNSIFEIVSASPSNVVRSDYIQMAASAIGADYTGAMRDFGEYMAKKSRFAQHGGEIPNIVVNKKQRGILTNAEYDTLFICLHNEKVGNRLAEIISDEWVDTSSLAGAVLAKYLACTKEGIEFSVSSFDSVLESEDEKNLVYEILSKEEVSSDDVVHEANECAERIWKKHCRKHIAALNAQLRDSGIAPDKLMEILKNLKIWQKSLQDYPWKLE